MSDFKFSTGLNGSAAEELYFHRVNRKLIEKIHRKAPRLVMMRASFLVDKNGQHRQRIEKFAEDSGGLKFKKAA